MKATVRDFPAALAAKILRHHMQREDEPSHSPICCKQLLASKQSEYYPLPEKDPNIKSFCGAEREPAKQACYESCEASSCVFHKKRLAEGTRPPRPPRVPRIPINQNLKIKRNSAAVPFLFLINILYRELRPWGARWR